MERKKIKLRVMSALEQIPVNAARLKMAPAGKMIGDADTDTVCGSCGALIAQGMRPVDIAAQQPGVPIIIECLCSAHNSVGRAGD